MTCEQEMCPNWDGWGCPCDVLHIEKPAPKPQCPECGNVEGMLHSAWDGWSCCICDWEANPL